MTKYLVMNMDTGLVVGDFMTAERAHAHAEKHNTRYSCRRYFVTVIEASV